MTSTLQLPQTSDATFQRRRGHPVSTPAPMMLDLTHLDLNVDVVPAVCDCPRGSASAPRVLIKTVLLTPAQKGRLRAIPRPGGTGVHDSIDAATTP